MAESARSYVLFPDDRSLLKRIDEFNCSNILCIGYKRTKILSWYGVSGSKLIDTLYIGK
jgi:hypothetical protein